MPKSILPAKKHSAGLRRPGIQTRRGLVIMTQLQENISFAAQQLPDV
jgi:hypothetical protein